MHTDCNEYLQLRIGKFVVFLSTSPAWETKSIFAAAYMTPRDCESFLGTGAHIVVCRDELSHSIPAKASALHVPCVCSSHTSGPSLQTKARLFVACGQTFKNEEISQPLQPPFPTFQRTREATIHPLRILTYRKTVMCSGFKFQQIQLSNFNLCGGEMITEIDPCLACACRTEIEHS